MASLPKQHTFNLFLHSQHSKKAKYYHLSIDNLTSIQHQKIKSSIVNTNNWLNKGFLFFDRLHKKLLSGFWLVDNFPDYFSFYTVNCKNIEVKNTHLYTLDKIFENSVSNSNTVLIISDASIKNNIATSILHICSCQNILAKKIYQVTNITSTKVEFFFNEMQTQSSCSGLKY